MINAKGLKELNPKDQERLLTLLAMSPETLTSEQRGHLVARRDYLEEEDLKNFKIKGAEETEDEETKVDYNRLKVDNLLDECEKRNIEVDEDAKKADLVEALEADDKGELEEK